MHIRICFLQSTFRPLSQARIPVFAAALLLFVCCFAHAQCGSSRPSSQLPDPAPTPEKGDHPDFGDPVNEIKTKLLIREDKKQYEENLARAKEADDLAAELCTSYEAKRTFTYEDEKKLERLEKLTKRIRNEAGGSDKNADENDPPNIVENAVKKVAETADVLRKEVEKTPRRVVSAAVIDQANKLIGLIQYLRNQGRR